MNRKQFKLLATSGLLALLLALSSFPMFGDWGVRPSAQELGSMPMRSLTADRFWKVSRRFAHSHALGWRKNEFLSLGAIFKATLGASSR
jgi:hypothetical protein